ncbi:MAG TPA: glycosyltransferase family 4 protein [Candidatus Dormibacteraeota bacterium]|nr:glycosyltransferase family 4 protein [Candidatus Dormibacteraeota bacterium]
MHRVLVLEQGEGVWGAQKCLLRLAPLLADRGVELVLAGAEGTPLSDAWKSTGLPLIPISRPSRHSVRTGGDSGGLDPRLIQRELRNSLRASRRIAELARSNGCSAILGNDHWSHLEASMAGLAARRPAVLQLHEETMPGLARHFRACSVRMAAATMAVSNAVAAQVPLWARGAVHRVPNGVDTNVFRPGPADLVARSGMTGDSSAFLVLVMSRLDRPKGVDQVIRAAASIPKSARRIHLAVAGETTVDPDYAAEVRELGRQLLGDRVRFLGARDDIPSLLRSADALALGSSLEGMPLSILEAQASRLPVVAYSTAGVPELIENEVTGFLVNRGDITGLAAAIDRLASDRALCEQLAGAAYERILADFSLSRQADTQAAIFRRVMPAPTALAVAR